MVKGRQQYKINAKNWNEHEMTNFTKNEPCYTCTQWGSDERFYLSNITCWSWIKGLDRGGSRFVWLNWFYCQAWFSYFEPNKHVCLRCVIMSLSQNNWHLNDLTCVTYSTRLHVYLFCTHVSMFSSNKVLYIGSLKLHNTAHTHTTSSPWPIRDNGI